MAGFMSGGRFGSLPSWIAASVVSTVLVCGSPCQPCTPPGLPYRRGGKGVHTSPFSSVKTSVTLSPATCLSVTSEATQPSAVSGCHARVPTSKMCAMVCRLRGYRRGGGRSDGGLVQGPGLPLSVWRSKEMLLPAGGSGRGGRLAVCKQCRSVTERDACLERVE